jgi:DNA-binding NtrC family response regulator
MRFAGVMSTDRAQMRVYEPLTHRAEDGHEPCKAAAMASTQHTTAKVLVVDDDAIARELLGHVLRAGGFQPILSSTGEHALLMLIRHRGDIDWLFTKLKLPGLVCGAILAEEFHLARPKRPVILAFSPDRAVPHSRGEACVLASAAAPMKVLALLKKLRSAEAPRNAGSSQSRSGTASGSTRKITHPGSRERSVGIGGRAATTPGSSERAQLRPLAQ